MKSKSILLSLLLSLIFLLLPTDTSAAAVKSLSEDYSFIILNTYEKAVRIGDEFYLFAFTSNGKKPTFKSSNSKIASVNTYGLITAKKDGTVKITAKIKDAEASCYVTVEKTKLYLDEKKASLECGSTLQLNVRTSNDTAVKFKSNKSSVAAVDDHGMITAKKPGEATIKITADTTIVNFKVTVKSPSVKMSQTKASLFRLGTLKLSCTVSSGKTPTWKSNRKSVATVDENGVVTAVKHGTAIITAKVDGVSKTCEITVKQPVVYLNESDLTLTLGESFSLSATVSSGNTPVWSSSNTSVATVEHGVITTHSKGTAYIYAAEDGIKARCKIKVILPETAE